MTYKRIVLKLSGETLGYVQVGDNEYVYSPLKEFSVQIYCETVINNNRRSKDVAIAMLHLGTEAQKYFNYNTGDLANANIVNDYPSKEYQESMIDGLNMDFTYDFDVSEKVIDIGKTLSLEGAIQMDAFYDFNGDVSSAELLVWKDVSGKLDLADAAVYNMVKEDGVYLGTTHMVASKRYGDTVYICARFTDTKGNVHYGEVEAFSPDYYCQKVIEGNKRSANVARKMAIYSEEARAYFGYY